MRARLPPPIRGVLETAIYSDDLSLAHAFYGGMLGLQRVLDTPRMLTYTVAPRQVLLVFKRGATREDSVTPEGVIPGHHSEGPAHFAFAVDDVPKALEIAQAHGVRIASPLQQRPDGFKQAYIYDPDDHIVEIVSR